MEKTYEFEIHFDDQEIEALIGAIDIIEAIYKLMDIFRKQYNILLTSDNFILIGEQDVGN